MANSKKRASNPVRAARRAASFKRGEKRKEGRIKAQKEREKINKELRAKGLPTAHEARVEAYRARRDARIAEAKANGTYKPTKFNERGFVIETVDGKTVLRDPDNWNKRRNKRYSLIHDGKIRVTDI